MCGRWVVEVRVCGGIGGAGWAVGAWRRWRARVPYFGERTRYPGGPGYWAPPWTTGQRGQGWFKGKYIASILLGGTLQQFAWPEASQSILFALQWTIVAMFSTNMTIYHHLISQAGWNRCNLSIYLSSLSFSLSLSIASNTFPAQHTGAAG